VLRLGSLILATVLLGVPRALDARAFGAQRSVYLEVAPQAPELTDFMAELERAISAAALSLATRPTGATMVIEVQSLATARTSDGGRMEAVSLVVRDGASALPLILHYSPPHRARAATRLVEKLSA
jgi:DNA integrity scanning protein DisA with diadenylate cyclase activity